jgi:hypothetical protein
MFYFRLIKKEMKTYKRESWTEKEETERSVVDLITNAILLQADLDVVLFFMH